MPDASTGPVKPDSIPAKKQDIPATRILANQTVKTVIVNHPTPFLAEQNPEKNPDTVQEKEVQKKVLAKSPLEKREPEPTLPGKGKNRAKIKVIIAGSCCRMENGSPLKPEGKEEKPKFAMQKRMPFIPKNRFDSTSTWLIVEFAPGGRLIN